MGFRRSLIGDMFRNRAKPAETEAGEVVSPEAKKLFDSIMSGIKRLEKALKDNKQTPIYVYGRRSLKNNGYTIYVMIGGIQSITRAKHPGLKIKISDDGLKACSAFSAYFPLYVLGEEGLKRYGRNCEQSDASLTRVTRSNNHVDVLRGLFSSLSYRMYGGRKKDAVFDRVISDIEDHNECAERAQKKLAQADAALNLPRAEPAGQ